MAPPYATDDSMLSVPYWPVNIGYRPPAKRQARNQARHRPVPKSRLQETALWTRVKKKTWAEAKDNIERLYFKEEYSLRVVMNIMWCLYQFGVRHRHLYKSRLRNWNIRKNRAAKESAEEPERRSLDEPEDEAQDESEDEAEDEPEDNPGPSKRSRAQTRHGRPLPHISEDTTTTEILEFDFHRHNNSEVTQAAALADHPNLYKYHERVLHSVDRFVFVIFGSRKNGWSADTIGFLKGDGTRCPETNRWRAVSDRCHSVAALVRSKLSNEAETTLDQLLHDLRGLLSSQKHPNFIATFWMICLRLLSIESHIPQAKPIDQLFSLILDSQPEIGEKNKPNPIYLLVDSLRHIDRRELKSVLRVGYVKTLMALTEVIGDENIVVLEMLSFYCRFFATKYLTRQTLIAKFEYVWHLVHSSHAEDTTESIAIDYSFAYAAYYVCDAPYITLGMAQRLRNVVAHHPSLACPAQWSLEAEAFSFASLVVARIYREKVRQTGMGSTGAVGAIDECAKAIASIQGAVEKLESGDRDCRTRAASLSRLLALWFSEWGLTAEARKAELRTRTIEGTIPGRTCRGCLRERYCRGCVAYILETSVDGPWESCVRCKPHKFSRLCQKCKRRGRA